MRSLISRRRLVDYKELSDHEKKNLTILEAIRRRAPISRAEIARITDFNIVTVTSYVDQYLKKSILEEVGIESSSGGRKPTLVDLKSNEAYAIGIGINAIEIICVLCNLKGKVIARFTAPRPTELGEQVITSMVDLVGELINGFNGDISMIHGIGIGFPGILNRVSNTARWPTGRPPGIMDKQLTFSLSLNDKFEKKFGISTILDNDANTAVFGEQWFSSLLNIENAIYLYSGSGCGLLINKRIYRGHSGSAGEWLFNTGVEPPGSWEKKVFDEGAWSIDMGITYNARDRILSNRNSQIYARCNCNANDISLSMVFDSAKEGDEFAISLISEAGRALGKRAALLVNMLNPEMIIIGGGLEKGGIHLINAFNQSIKELAVPEATERLKVAPSQLGQDSVALGAAALVIQSYYVGG